MWWNNQNPKPPKDYVRPTLTDEEILKLQAYVHDNRRVQLSEKEQNEKCGATAKYQKRCPKPIDMCKKKDEEPEFICPGQKKGSGLPECSKAIPLPKPPKCPVYDSPCASDEVIGPAILLKTEETKAVKKNIGAYKCKPDDDDDNDPCKS